MLCNVCVLYVVNEFVNLLASKLDVMLVAELLYSVREFITCIFACFWSEKNAESCACNGSAEECAYVT